MPNTFYWPIHYEHKLTDSIPVACFCFPYTRRSKFKTKGKWKKEKEHAFHDLSWSLISRRFNIFKKPNYLLHAWSLERMVSSAQITNLKGLLHLHFCSSITNFRSIAFGDLFFLTSLLTQLTKVDSFSSG